eukprot:TRINITY_DN35601_c0_g1_i1.p1 TRINITY_DN35601_c0_g1~~TRINITY_DN35601_c0_g1_i1.p1  ORF type:complete len:468 (-),score=-52.95 TRINITY_DN35601_c0_g1_i1:122-1525(-)
MAETPPSATGKPDEPTEKATQNRKLTLIPLIFLIFFEVSGGPYGEETAVKAAGPLLAILGFLVFPFVWSIPEALVTAELATSYPGNGGYVIWAREAFGDFWGFQMGWAKWISGVINNAAYPALCLDYLSALVPAFAAGAPRAVGTVTYTIILTYLNYAGLDIVGWTAVGLGTVSLLPFFVMAVAALPEIRPSRWLRGAPAATDWGLYFNTLFWNLNFWDNASTLAGEVRDPQRTFPRALLCAGFLAVAGYVAPLVAATGAIDGGDWGSGYLAVAAGQIAGGWLKAWVEVGSVLSTVGLFEAQLSSASFQLLGMAGVGMVPSVMGHRSAKYQTPAVGIAVSAGGTLAIAFLSFTEIISAANFLYSCGMLLEFAAFLWLRRKRPDVKRPYRVPLGIPGLVVMCAVPVTFLVFVMTLATPLVFGISAGIVAAGVGSYFLLGECRSRALLRFSGVASGARPAETECLLEAQ